MRRVLIGALLLAGYGYATPETTHAACTGSSPTWTSTPDEASLQSCLSGASLNDTINVTSGSGSITTTLIAPNDLNLSLVGAGVDVTTLSGSAPTLINFGKGNKRISGFTFTITGGATAIQIDGDGWRVDHIKSTSTNTSLTNAVHARGLRVGAPYGPTGLVDHVDLTNGRVIALGYPDVASGGNAGYVWNSELGLGDANAVYLEDSTVTRTVAFSNTNDCDYGGRLVMRNTVTAGSNWETHSPWNGFRGCRRFEFYNNTLAFTFPFFTPVTIRGGTGVIFGNVIDGGWTEPYISMDVRRAFETPTVWGRCDGTQQADGNTHVSPAADAGWLCRDQPGTGGDVSNWTIANPYPAQYSTPIYLWENTIGGSPATVNIRNGVSAWIAANRDYFNHAGGVQTSATSPFNGTSGTGVGTLANRPTTCSVNAETGIGVGYWATDQGTWNKTPGGAQGVLYRCTATNTWTLYYTPYEYPHPLAAADGGGGGGTIPFGSTVGGEDAEFLP